MKFLKNFGEHTDYNNYINNEPVLPNISFCKNEKHIHYNPTEKRMVCEYNVTDISSTTALRMGDPTIYKSMEIDGILLDSIVTNYQFSSTGKHIVKYELQNATTVGVTSNTPIFYNISALVKVIIPKGVTTITGHAFQNCPNLTTVVLPQTITTINSYAFGENPSLQSFTIPRTINTINECLFAACTGLTSIIIPDNITTIEANAFYNCSNLISVTFTSTVPPTINFGVFGNNAAGRKIFVPAESVNAYKTASTPWENYASDIEAIPN